VIPAPANRLGIVRLGSWPRQIDGYRTFARLTIGAQNTSIRTSAPNLGPVERVEAAVGIAGGGHLDGVLARTT
jgi:hypothetical protein